MDFDQQKTNIDVEINSLEDVRSFTFRYFHTTDATHYYFMKIINMQIDRIIALENKVDSLTKQLNKENNDNLNCK